MVTAMVTANTTIGDAEMDIANEFSEDDFTDRRTDAAGGHDPAAAWVGSRDSEPGGRQAQGDALAHL